MIPTSLSSYIELLKNQFHLISEERLETLDRLANIILSTLKSNDVCRIMSICTHNSRRSQLMEAWLVAASQYYNIEGVSASSGGTEATGFNIRMVLAMRQAGFHLIEEESGQNPRYNLIPLHETALGHQMFSKKYDESFNPQNDFIAIMVCDHADQNCPVVLGANHRISLPFLDPKVDDNTPMEHETYMGKIEEIGREIIYIMSKVA
ncbi:MAG: arsenate reductase [Saprospiraceae bacterium]|jgi:arsenate reductase